LRPFRPLAAVVIAASLLGACESAGALGERVTGILRPDQPTPVAPPPAANPAEPVAERGPAAVEPLASTATPDPALRPARTGPPRVALLLPLTGPNAAVGQALLDAATQAVFDVADDDFVLLVRDTAGTPEGAAAALDWAREQQARLVVGPLLGLETQAIGAAARAAEIPVLSLSNDRNVAGPGVYTLGIAPQDAIARTIAYARSRGLEKFAALIPNNALGAASEAAMRATLGATGGELVRVERYEPGTLDFGPAVRRLGRIATAPQRLARGETPSPPPELDFEAVLLPDFGDRLVQLVAELHGHEIDPARVKYLGIPLWDDPRLLRESSLQGAWFAAPPTAGRGAFERRYREAFGRPPPRVASLAYDAVALAAILARGKGPDGADYTLEALQVPAGFAGVDGLFRFGTGGTVERGFAVMEVRRDGARTISPAPDAFEAPSN
jgi:ABC-type branched-subunit amino acid transport system substrate-binding protein